jgi:chromosome segregation ATPase
MADNPKSELEQALKEKQDELRKQQAQLTYLNEDIGTLQKAINEEQQMLNAYNQTRQSLQSKLDDLGAYVTAKRKIVDPAVKGQRAKIENVISSFDGDLAKQAEALEKLQQAQTKAEGAYNDTQEEYAGKLKVYDDLKNTQKSLEASLKAAQDLKDRIEKEADKNNVAKMYFLLKELDGVLNKAKPLSKDELGAQLRKAWADLDEAKQRLRKAKERADQAKDEAAKAQATYTTWQSSRRERILEGIEQLNAEPLQDDAEA